MSDTELPDLFTLICRLDDIADALFHLQYDEEAERVRDVSAQLKGYVELRLVDPNDVAGR